VQATVERIRSFADRPGRAVDLREVGGPRVLTIVIGVAEADALAVCLQGVALPRPLSHDLMLHLVETAGARVERVTITRWERDTTMFFATVAVRRGRARPVSVDARPSDAVNLALRAGVPIYVAREVMDGVGIAPEDPVWGKSTAPCEGVLELTAERGPAERAAERDAEPDAGAMPHGFLRGNGPGRPRADDVRVPAALVEQWCLRDGDRVEGLAREGIGGENHRVLVAVERVNGVAGEQHRAEVAAAHGSSEAAVP